MKFLLLLVSMLCVVAFGQEVPYEIPPELAGILSFLGPLLGSFALKYPIIGDIFSVMLLCRVIIKPLMSALITMAEGTEIKFLDDIAKFADGKVYKLIAFILDWVFSVKLPKKA